MEFFKKEKFYLHGHYMKFLIEDENSPYSDPCMFCPFDSLSEDVCKIPGPQCNTCVDAFEVIFCEIKYKRF